MSRQKTLLKESSPKKNQNLNTPEKGLFKKAGNFLYKHIQKGERIWEKERLIHEYALDEYMEQFRNAFDYEEDFKSAKSYVINELLDDYLQNNPDRKKFTFKPDYLESRIEDLFALKIAYFVEKNSSPDFFEINGR